MSQSGVKRDSQVKPEYSVYVYHYPDDIEDGHSDWEKKQVTRSKIRAMSVARKLHDSASFRKVEVKRKAFENRYDCMIDRTFKVYQSPRPEQYGSVGLLSGVKRFVKQVF